MLAEQSRIKVVPVQVRHVQEVDLAVPVPIQAAVVGEDEPRAEVGRVLPRVTQDRPAGSLDMQASMAQTRDLHLTAYCLGAACHGRASQRPSPHLVTVATPLGRRKSTHKTRFQRIGLAFQGATRGQLPSARHDQELYLTPFSGERVRRRCGSRTTGAGRPGNLARNAGPQCTPVSPVIWPDLSGDPVKIPRKGADHDWSLRAAAVCAAARPARGRGGHAASAVYGRTG